MWRAIRAAVAAASCVPIVPAVPAFAQSDTAARPLMALERTSASAAREYVPAELVDVAPRELPPNLLIPRLYRPLLESTLRHSPTFARQCGRIANAPELSVTLEFVSSPPWRAALPSRARTRIVRDGHRLIATIVIARTIDVVELVAHEIEHVIEQLDGVDLASKALRRDSGVHALHHEGAVFETTRARRTGLRVAEEVRRPQPRTVRLGW